MKAQTAIREALQFYQRIYGVNDFGLACHYTGIRLSWSKVDSTKGDYISFDHAIPNDPSRAVVCSRIINDLKGWMTEHEFRTFASQYLDASSNRRIHGLSFEETAKFLHSVRAVTKDFYSYDIEHCGIIKALSSCICYKGKGVELVVGN